MAHTATAHDETQILKESVELKERGVPYRNLLSFIIGVWSSACLCENVPAAALIWSGALLDA